MMTELLRLGADSSAMLYAVHGWNRLLHPPVSNPRNLVDAVLAGGFHKVGPPEASANQNLCMQNHVTAAQSGCASVVDDAHSRSSGEQASTCSLPSMISYARHMLKAAL